MRTLRWFTVTLASPATSAAEDDTAVVGVGEVPPPRPPADAMLSRSAPRLGKPMPTDRLRGWIATLTLAVIGGVLRFQNLGFPTDNGTPIFDEKHYVPQAWQMLRNGGYEDNPGYELTVHPPLGKYFIAVGEWLFGYNGWGWRFSAALAGTIMIILIIRIARRMTRSTLLGAVAGVLLICDGVSHVQSRMGMLDVFGAVMVLGAFACLLVDRDQVRQRLALAVEQGWLGTGPYGPRLGFRWWRFAAGVVGGLSAGVKWDGAFWIAMIGIVSMLFDVSARHAAGVRKPWLGTIVRDLAPALWSLAVIPVLAYLSTWWGWFASETGIERHVVGGYSYNGPGVPAGGPWSFVPAPLRALWYYNGNMLSFHSGLTTAKAGQHPWESKPWSWPMGLRPMLYGYSSGEQAAGCGESSCVSATMLVGTPAMWWLSLPMLAFAAWRSVTRFDWRYATVLGFYLTGILPWFTNEARQMYFFYMTPVAPFLILGITLVLGEILGKSGNGPERRKTGILVVALYVGLVAANFAWLWPILNGTSITNGHWNAELWLPSWH